ncbi:glycerate kinase [Sporosarcina sp. Te-1]|uniref:glycerate kinase n=1 Tax=Sporosarcina sp. Te-1 TaxID=2818390 RepID=UPI001A9D4A9E|nr:glycerate kinase [Sporosarcina sp. Te-1]QTD40460.1 glycerate kinase [Sporosarcina sp. Te-1]
MKIILAPDSFKGSLTAREAALAMEEGICEAVPSAERILMPLADGGEGTVDCLVGATRGQTVSVRVYDPLRREIVARYGILGDGATCVIEIAEASGLPLLKEEERDPMITTSYGTGQLIQHALDAGYRTFIIGLGGSATNDGGTGILQALGCRFLDVQGKELAAVGGALHKLHKIDLSQFDQRIMESSFTIACDVQAPFIGPTGASAVFGPQKGASEAEVALLDQNLKRLADCIEEEIGLALHDMEGTGAAGGAGGALLAFFQGIMKPGIEVVMEAMDFERIAEGADLLITGEGRSDGQTITGKAPSGVASLAERHEIPVLLISGAIDEASREMLRAVFTEVHGLTDCGIKTKIAMSQSFRLLREKTAAVVGDYVESVKTDK